MERGGEMEAGGVMEARADGIALGCALRKAHWRILPLLGVCYLVAYMDRANISFAAESMNRDLHFSPHVYGTGAGLFFLSYACFQIPANKLLLRFGARRWLALIMAAWGVVAIATMLVHAQATFYGMRLLLGLAEAGFFPGVIYYMAGWFPKSQRARAMSLFYLSYPLSVVLMGAVAGVLLKLNGRMGLRGWQWLFLVEGLPALVLSVWVWRTLADGPATARWLDEPERAALECELVEGTSWAEQKGKASLREVLGEWRVWMVGLFYFCIVSLSYGIALFLPEMMRSLTHWTPQRVGFLISLQGLVAAVAMVLNAMHSDRSGERRWHVVVPVALMGALLLLAAAEMHGMTAWVAVLLVMVLYTSLQGPLLVIVTSLRPGEDAALVVATFNMCGLFGGFAGPYWMGWMREITGGYGVGVGGLAVLCAVAAVSLLWLTRSSGASEVVGRA